MQLTHLPGAPHLMYCTNIHAGDGWADIRASLDEYIPAIRSGLAWPGQFAIGLRLSAHAAATLATAPALHELQLQLHELKAYVPSINAFPYGAFHGTVVKHKAYLPDWHGPQRLAYTLQCADILAALLPSGISGSISTLPGASRMAGTVDKAEIARNMVQLVAHLVSIERTTGKHIALALEPEPCCMLETVSDTVAYFGAYLFAPQACSQLAQRIGCSHAAAQRLLRRHVGVCLDVCHAAVEFEDPVACLQQLGAAGISIPKIQISCAVHVAAMRKDLAGRLRQLDDGVYLHQVVARLGEASTRFTDLPEALAAFEAGQACGEWRIHCHVPVYAVGAGPIAATQAELLSVLASLKSRHISPHLEVETYTWDVLPGHLKTRSKADSIADELSFVIDALKP